MAESPTPTPPSPPPTADPGGPSAVGPAVPPPADRYTLGEEIARGGMGAVYAAYDRVLDRRVAVKVLLPAVATPPNVRRFLDEARVTGGLQHPGVPPVYDLGTLPDGRPFLAMKLIEGQTLQHRLAGGATDLSGLVPVFEQVANTVAFAHSRGVVHRDLKPQNVMVGAFGEVQVMDWGLAKAVRGSGCGVRREDDPDATALADPPPDLRAPHSDDATRAGSVLGTPAYMPPEQARGEVDRIGPAADVFALGGILCAILTGQPPFVGPTREVLGRAARGDTAEAFRRLDRGPHPAELARLAKDCLAADPADRPADAGAVAARVAGYRADADRRLRRAEVERAAAEARAREQRKRRRVQLGLALAVIALLAGGGAAGWAAQERRAEAARRRAEGTEAVRAALAKVEAVRAQLDRHAVRDVPTAEAAVALHQSAANAAEQADGLARAGPVPDDVRARAADALADSRRRLGEAEAARDRLAREAAFAAAIDRARPALAAAGRTFDPAPRNAAFAAAFRDLGVDLSGDPAASAGKLRRLASAEARSVALWTLLEWSADPRSDAASAARAGVVLAEADDDAWRKRLGEAVRSRKPEELARVVDEAAAGGHPPQTYVVLSQALPPADRVAVLARGQEAHPGDFWINYYLGFLLIDDQPHRAVAYLRAAQAVQPGAAYVYASLGHALRRAKDPDGAVRAYRRCVESGGPTAPVLYSLAAAHGDKGEYEAGFRCLDEAERLDPRYAEVHALRGDLLRRAGDLPGAIASYRQAVGRRPAEAAWRYTLAAGYLANGQPDEAIGELREAARVDPRHEPSRKLLASALASRVAALTAEADRAAAPDARVAALRRVVALDPQRAEAFARLGLVLLKEKNAPAEAAAAYRRAAELRPDDASLWFHLGAALVGANDGPGSLAAFRTAAEKDPGRDVYWVALGAAQRDAGDVRAALASLAKAVAVGPKNPSTHANLGVVQRIAGDRPAAVASFRKALELDPKLATVHYYLGGTLADEGDRAGAAACFRRAVELDPKLTAAREALDALGEM